MKRLVQVKNPPAGFSDRISVKTARRFVANGRAVFVAPLMIRLVEQALAMPSVLEASAAQTPRISARWYDQINRTLSVREMRHLPLINPEKLIRREKSNRDWSYTTAVFRGAAKGRGRNVAT